MNQSVDDITHDSSITSGQCTYLGDEKQLVVSAVCFRDRHKSKVPLPFP